MTAIGHIEHTDRSDQTDQSDQSDTAPAPKQKRRRRRGLRVALWTLLAVVLAALGAGGWALNRYVIDHVEIGDVRSYESSVQAGTTDAPIATFPSAG